jgi:hypothetical protein
MVSRPLRALCAFAAVSLFLGGVAGLVVAPGALYTVALLAAALLAMPAMFGGKKPQEHDLAHIDEHLHRFRSAMFLCFAAAMVVYAFVISARRAASEDLLQQLASLGVSLWVVGFVLLFFAMYYRAQRRLVTGNGSESTYNPPR